VFASSSLTNKPELRNAFFVDSKVNHWVTNERLCILRIKGRCFNYSVINKHVPTNDSEEEAKDQFYEQYTNRLLGDTARIMKTASKDSHHMLVVIKLRYRISRVSNMTPQQLRCFAVERLNDGNVATMCRLETELSGASQTEPLSLDNKWKQMEKAVQKVAINFTHENKREKIDSTWSAKI
jgi:hypothetical protein